MKLRTADGQVFDVMCFDKIKIRRQGKMINPERDFVELEAKGCGESKVFYTDVLHSRRDDFHIDAEIKYYAWLLFKVATKVGREIHDEEVDWAVEKIVQYVEHNTTLPILDDSTVEGFYAQLTKKINDFVF